jgi:hypothetical protein
MNTITLSSSPQTFPQGVINGYNARKRIRESREFQDFNQAWNDSNLGYWQEIGHCMETIRAHRPKTGAQWVETYFTHCKTWDEIQAVGAKWAALTGLDERMATAHIIIRAIDQTWEGYHGELLSEQLMVKYHATQGQTVREANEIEDREYGVDFVVLEGDRIVMGVQVKGFRFFYSKRIEQALKRYKWQNDQFTAMTGAPVYYVNTKNSEEGRLKYIRAEDILKNK